MGDSFMLWVLVLFVIVGFFGVFGYLFVFGKLQVGGDVLLVMFGLFGMVWMVIIVYYYGSFVGSLEKMVLFVKR